MQISDRGEAQLQRVGCQRLCICPGGHIALRRQEGGDVLRAGGEGREAMAVAPGAPRAYAGPVGAACIVRLCPAGECGGDGLGCCERAVG